MQKSSIEKATREGPKKGLEEGIEQEIEMERIGSNKRSQQEKLTIAKNLKTQEWIVRLLPM